MSLLSEAMSTCTMLDRRTIPDGYGGYSVDWTEGASFDAAITVDTSLQAKVAEKQGVTSLYSVVTGKEMNLQYNDVFRCNDDGKVFRVTSDGDYKKTPSSATLNMRVVSAEEFNLVLDNG